MILINSTPLDLDKRLHSVSLGLEEVRSDFRISHHTPDLSLGKNICLGQRMAKLEMKLVAAMFLLGTDFSIVDAAGRTPELVPRPDWNDILGCKPPKGSCLFDYHVRC